MALLGHYGVSSNDSLTFEVIFEIPINCNYNITISGKISTINIQLNSGQTVPSTSFIMYTEDFVTSDSCLILEFKQNQTSGSVTKPKISVNN